MELADYLQIIRRRWVLIVVTMLVATSLAALVTITATRQYQSTARLFITTPTAAADGDSSIASGGQFSQQRVLSYATLIKGEEVASRVVKQLGLKESPLTLASHISTSVETDTVVLSVSVTDPNAERAQELTQTTAEVFTQFVKQLETPDGQSTAPIKATIVDEATRPSSPVSPKPVRNIALGAILGLLLGVGIAILREILDNRVTSTEDITTVSGEEVPMLGNIYYDKRAVREPMVRGLSSHHPRMESFRVLRTNLQFVDPGQSHKVYIVTSSVPGEGKSSTSANLAHILAEGGQRVLLIEADLRRGKMSKYLNLESSVGLTTILLGRVKLADAAQSVNRNLDVLTGGRVPPNPAELLASDDMRQLLAEAREAYDIVLIDCPPLLPVTDAAVLASETDGAIVVVRHGSTTVDQLQGAFERLRAVDARICGTVVTMTPPPSKSGSTYRYGYGVGYGYGPDTEPGSRADRGSSDSKSSDSRSKTGG